MPLPKSARRYILLTQERTGAAAGPCAGRAAQAETFDRLFIVFLTTANMTPQQIPRIYCTPSLVYPHRRGEEGVTAVRCEGGRVSMKT